ncbi:hypothetical protein CC78DRAFT_536285 [Lojkania enalia]|uniref:Uncharacterized protein n=1 Tax=Lojkania enalia TaxID=147567 RepID=A0A9P4K5S1_9PLEO|nr:hypothetical protein CC78DRAFT_536285 [Didymosphaeria enalia]
MWRFMQNANQKHGLNMQVWSLFHSPRQDKDVLALNMFSRIGMGPESEQNQYLSKRISRYSGRQSKTGYMLIYYSD